MLYDLKNESENVNLHAMKPDGKITKDVVSSDQTSFFTMTAKKNHGTCRYR